MIRCLYVFVFSLVLFSWIPGHVCFLKAQEAVKIRRLTTPVEFDGRPVEEAWQELQAFELVMHRPNYMAQPSEGSDIRIGYDDEFLWIGASLYMKDASEIYAVSKKRDEGLFDYDAIGIILDTYNDNETGLAFYTTPTGLRTDYAISNDAVGEFGPAGYSAMNDSWNTFWDVETTRDGQGWYVEMRIPFSSLKFKPEGDVATMGLIIVRNISANVETDTYPAIDPKYGFMATNKPSQARKIEIEGARPTNPVYISPYVMGGFSRDWKLSVDETAYEKNDSPVFNGGLDVKYNINSNLTLDLTANTDFAQVEADDQQVNLTRYSLFFPEKRKFFQERASLFDFSLGNEDDKLFYSRRIGITEEGDPVRIYGGARITGKLGNWDMGFLDLQTAAIDTLPGENFGVLRMRRQVINPNSYVGGMLTSRIGMNGEQNVAYGVDGIFRLFGDDYLNVKWSQAYESESGTGLNSMDPSFVLVDWKRRSEKGLAYNFNYTYSGREYNPGAGFIMRNGVQGVSGQLLFGWIPGENSRLFNYNVNIRGRRYSRLEDGGLESMDLFPGIEFNTKSGIFGEAGLKFQKEGVLEDFPLSDSVAIDAGEYTFTAAEIRFGTSEAYLLSTRGDAYIGQFYDGNRIGFRLEPTLNLSASLKLSGGYEFNAIRFPGRESHNALNIHSVNLRALYMFSTKLSISLFGQYVNTEDALITNFRLRYNPREGNDFYVVFNDFRGVMKDRSEPPIPSYFNETIMVKYAHTFILQSP